MNAPEAQWLECVFEQRGQSIHFTFPFIHTAPNLRLDIKLFLDVLKRTTINSVLSFYLKNSLSYTN